MLTVVLSSIVIATVSSWGLVRALIPQLSRQLLDQPNARSSTAACKPASTAVAASRIRWFCIRCRGSIPSSTRTLRANARVSSNGCGAVAALTASKSRWR